jgi:hypothetical protein
MRKGCEKCQLQTETRFKGSMAWEITCAILKEFSLRHLVDHKNYWGLAGCKPCMLAEIVAAKLQEGVTA